LSANITAYWTALIHEGLAMIVGALLFIRTIAEQRITDR